MRVSINSLAAAVLTISLYLPVHAQPLADIQKKYAGEQAVVLSHEMSYRISIKDGQPLVFSDESQRILYLSAESGAYLSKYSFSHSSFHELQQYSAYTVTADAKKIKVMDFKTADSKSDEVFFDDVKETSFSFPAIGPGSVGTLEVSEQHKDPHLLSPFFFSRGIPVINAELKLSFPKDMSVKYLLKGIDADKITVTKEVRHGENIYTFHTQDLPAEKPYADAPDVSWYTTHVIFYIESYKDEHSRAVSYLANPDDLYRLDHSFLENINKEAGPELRRIVDSLCQGRHTAEEKARCIYSWVQQSVKYIAFEQGMEGFVPRDANLVCSRRFGDCKDMSSILTLMLRTAGVPAWYTWIGTRALPYTFTETPLPLVDNHMICTVRLNDQYVFLDGTDPSCVFGMPSQGIQDKQAMVALGDSSYKILTVPTPAKTVNQLTDSTILDLTENGLKGRISIDMSGYYSIHLQDQLMYWDQKDKEEYMKNRCNRGSNKFRLDSFRIGDRNDKDHIRLTAGFTLQDYAKHISGEWYLNLNLFKFYEHEEIEYPKRRSPIEFPFLYQRRYVVVLNIPDGYDVSELPAGKDYHNAVWGFTLKYEKKNRQLILTQEFDNDHLLLRPEQFADWNKVLEHLIPLYKETISLEKKV